ncbi:hypothetical protein [Pinirhizobacter soli]|uniref:hypothetical protein n=1 Tax=Pinirhizobacter soli TaxID=2786953 RepID=UPI00202A78E7|nr:hypothetical protein [Pinirhizobacter soli]
MSDSIFTNAVTKFSAGCLARRLPVTALALAGLCGAAAHADELTRMAPVEAYLMDRTQEIALAKSAAPDSIAKDATVLVLTRTGYETAVKGTNGFVCYVGRGIGGAPDWPERWNPKIRAAACDNPPAVRSFTPLLTMRTAMTLTGHTDAQIMDRIKTALRTKEIPALEAGAMCYMMSKHSYLSAYGSHNMAHVMFYVPFADGKNWGANLPGSPVIGGNYWFLTPGHEAEAATLPPLSVYLVATSTWSDGTAVSMPAM